MLLPRVLELPGLHGAEAAPRLEELERYRCLEAFRMAPPPALAQACARLLCSVSALMHGGALRECGSSAGGQGSGCGQGQGSPGLTLSRCPQPASATRRAPAAVSASPRVGSASASPTSSAGAATAAPRAATASGRWAAAVSRGGSVLTGSPEPPLSVCAAGRALSLWSLVCLSIRPCMC